MPTYLKGSLITQRRQHVFINPARASLFGLEIDVIPAGGSGTIPIRLTSPGFGQAFKLRVWTSPVD
jgi:hypothetical protein